MGSKTTDIIPIVTQLITPGEVAICNACGTAVHQRGFYLPADKGGPMFFCEACVREARETLKEP